MNEHSLFLSTYNLASKSIERNDLRFVPKNFDIYILGFQEVAPFIPVICGKNHSELTSVLVDYFGTDYAILSNMTMLGLKLFIAVKKELEHVCTLLKEYTIPTGADGVYGNKGALAATLQVNVTNMLFINAHFTAHTKKYLERNQNYATIMNGIQNICKRDPFDYHSFIFLMGDLNYRIDGSYEKIVKLSVGGRISELLENDQLSRERKALRVFNGFHEERIMFPPTYKFDKKSFVYDTSKKKRVPSYTDRILIYSKSKKSIKIHSYDADMDILVSDHRPVHLKCNIIPDKTDVVKKEVKQTSAVCLI